MLTNTLDTFRDYKEPSTFTESKYTRYYYLLQKILQVCLNESRYIMGVENTPVILSESKKLPMIITSRILREQK